MLIITTKQGKYEVNSIGKTIFFLFIIFLFEFIFVAMAGFMMGIHLGSNVYVDRFILAILIVSGSFGAILLIVSYLFPMKFAGRKLESEEDE